MTDNGIFVPTPTDIPEIDPNTVNGPNKEFVLGTRSRLNKLIELINGGKWKSTTKNKEIKVYTKFSKSGLACVKGETYFPFDAEKIIEYIKRADIRHEYDKYTDEAFIIDEAEHRTLIVYAKIKKIMVVSSRDLTFATQLITSKKLKTMYTPTYSIELPDYPPIKKAVRAEMPNGGWVIMETPDGGSTVVYVSELDFKGSLPKFLIEKTADVQVSILTALKKYMIAQMGVKEGEVWKRPVDENVKGQSTVAKIEPYQEVLAKEKSNKSSGSKDTKDVESTEETKNEKNNDKIQKEAASSSLEELKVENKYFDLHLDLKNKVKSGTPEELGFDASFASLTEDDFIDQVSEDIEGKEMVLKAREQTLNLFKEINGTFDKLKTSKEIAIFTKDHGKEGNSVLGIGEIPFNIDKIAEILSDEKQRKLFDNLFDNAEIIEELPNSTLLVYVKFKKVLILSARDFVC